MKAQASEKLPISEILRRDIPASIVVFLVAVPLSLGIALASGAPIMAGLIAAAVGGIIVGLFGGAPLQVSGPAAGLTVLVYGIVTQFEWRIVCFITVLAGLMQLGLGFAKIARTALAITPAVVHGMLAGIGVVIALAQLHVVLGGSPQSSAIKNLAELPNQIATLHTPAAVIGLMTIAILFGWTFMPKKVQTVPGALVAVAVATVVSILFKLDVKRVDLPENLLADFTLPLFPSGNWGGVLVAAATIAIVASVESLLSAVATDKLHTGPRANLDKELIGQGAGNAISGLLGGLPITGVIVRSSANINSGAKSRLSGIMHGVWIIFFVALLGSVIEQIPLATLAGLLVFVGIRLVKIDDIKELHVHRESFIYFATLFGVAFINLLAGVGLGIGLAVFMLLRRLALVDIQVTERERDVHVDIHGSLTFITVPRLTKELADIPTGSHVFLEMHTDFMDHAAFEALHTWEKSHKRTGGTVTVDELHDDWYHSAVNSEPKPVRTPVVRNGKNGHDREDMNSVRNGKNEHAAVEAPAKVSGE